MQHGSGERTTAWTRDVGEAPAQRLDRNLQVDVCVVGAGIAGLTTAYMLTQRGRTVAVLDDGAIGGGETSRTTAHLSNVLDDRYFELERLHGVDGARLAADSHTQAITAIETHRPAGTASHATSSAYTATCSSAPATTRTSWRASWRRRNASG